MLQQVDMFRRYPSIYSIYQFKGTSIGVITQLLQGPFANASGLKLISPADNVDSRSNAEPPAQVLWWMKMKIPKVILLKAFSFY